MDILSRLKLSIKRVVFATGHARWYRKRDYLATLCRLYLEGYRNECSDWHRNGEQWVVRNVAEVSMGRALVVFDVGANTGEFALSVLKLAPAAVVHCFEPMPELARRLEERFRNDPRVNVHAFGLGRRSGHAVVHYCPSCPVLSTSSAELARLYKMHATEPVHVDMRAGDEVVRALGLPRVDLLKIDVEGTEGDVLHGCRDSLRRRAIGVVLFEYKGMNHLAGYALLDLYRFLHECGYAVGRLWPRGVEFDAYDPSLEGCSVSYHVAVPAEDRAMRSRLEVAWNSR